jgi:hypothetical protein
MAMEGVAACRVTRMIKSVTLYCIKVNGTSCGILKVFSEGLHFTGGGSWWHLGGVDSK